MEESFPRGGTQSKSAQPKIKKRPQENDNLFSTHHEEDDNEPIRKKKKTNLVREKPKFIRQEKRKTPVSKEQPVDILRFKNLKVGMLLLGCVKEVKDFEMAISLPYGMTGYAHATHICEAYSKILSEQAEKDVPLEALAPLPDLYCPGMLVRCAVSSLESTSRGFQSIKLSINPQDVNKLLADASLRPGMLLSGCVSSIEDHGYIIDLGVAGTKAFLPRQKAQVYLKQTNKSTSLKVGQYLNCVIEEVKNDGRIVRLSITQPDVAAAVATEQQNWSLNNLLPGLIVKATIKKVSNDKITLSFLSSFTSTVDFLHFEPKKSSEYSVNQEVKACILWVDPSSKNIRLTLRQSLIQPGTLLRQLSSSLTGSVLENCTVKALFKSVGALLELNGDTMGFAFKHQLLSKEEESKGLGKFKQGTSHTVRVLEFSPMDETIFVSLKPGIIGGLYLTHNEIKAGQLLEGDVVNIEPVGMEVRITSYISGLVPRLHLADVQLHQPELKYKKGLKIKCRVLTIVPSAKKLILTRKRTLINSKLPIIASYQDAQPGLVTHGVIAAIKNYGCIIKFYNEVQGLALRRELSSEHIQNLEEVFYKGQVVKVRVVSCDMEKERMQVSFKIIEEEEEEDEQNSEKRLQNRNAASIEIGKMVDIKIVQKTEKGLKVVTLPEKKNAFLPKMHLSDIIGNCELFWHGLEEGDQLHGAMYLSKVKGEIILTRKPALISSLVDGECVKDISELQIGMILTGFVNTIMSYGVFVAFPYGLVGLAPRAALCDQFVTEIGDHFAEGQTVTAKVTEINEAKKRFLLTLKMSDCAPDDCSAESFARLSQCLQEHQLLRDLINSRDSEDDGHITTLVPGRKLSLVVGDVQEDGSFLFSVDQIPGAKQVSAAQCNLGDQNIVSGQKVKAVVLHVDAVKFHVHVSLDKLLMANKKERLKENSTFSAIVQHIADEFAVVSLDGTGHLAAVPLSSHINDTFRPSSPKLQLGQTVSLTLKTACAEEHGLLLAIQNVSTKNHRKSEQKAKKTAVKMAASWEIGEVVTGTVKTVKPTSVIVSIYDNLVGFIHVSQIAEDVTVGSYPTATLKPNQSISCRIIGGRDIKSHRFLPITHPNLKLSFPELSILPSVMDKDHKVPPPKDMNTYIPGQTITCFVVKYDEENKVLDVEVTEDIRGRIEHLLVCQSLKVLKRPDKHFRPGQALSATIIKGISSGRLLHLSLTGTPEFKEGEVVFGSVQNAVPGSGLIVSLPFGKTGKVDLTQISDCFADVSLENFTPGKIVRCYVLSISPAIQLSLRQSRVNPKGKINVKDPEITSVESLEDGQLVNGFVEKINERGIFFRLSSSVVGHIQFKNVTSYYVENHTVYKKHIPEGKLLTVKVLSKDTKENHVQLSLLPVDTGKPYVIPESAGLKQKKSKKRKQTASEGDTKVDTKKKKSNQEKTEDEDSGVEVLPQESKTKEKPKKKGDTKPITRLQVPASFSWDVSVETLKTSLVDAQESSSDSEDEEEQRPKTKKTKKEKETEKKAAEKELSKIEATLLDPKRQPQSADDFDRLVISSPNSSILWLQYMAFHLHATEIEKARAVAERALKTISFREEQEKLNVWVALLNLENMYGAEDTLLKAFERAVQYNEPLKVFLQLADIYIKSEKFKEAENLFNTMLKRFRQENTVWLKYATFLLKQGQGEATHRLLQRALKCLPEKEHIDVISKFAQLEFHLGDAERGKALFESTLSNYPKRTDLWSVYIDLMMKHGLQKEVRAIFERVINLSLAAKRIKFFFKRYLEYEKKHGTAENVQAVKEKALKYVESKSSLTNT
ncbi:protein RRP5 homolog [Pelobates fuscus]|uniref:protein RRP5 homolog n=1 Tax=Pelobates fuscus TaxID=191477 RepID=UPI002FE4A171